MALIDLNNPNLANENAGQANAEAAAAAPADAAAAKKLVMHSTKRRAEGDPPADGTAPAADPNAAAAAAATQEATKAPGSEFPNLEMFGDKNKIELPYLCKRSLDNKKLLGIAYNAKKFVGAWKKAAGSDDALFNNLPCLDGDQFATYYKEINANAKAASDEVAVADADTEKDNLIKVINFMDPGLTKACWLQYWVYMCSYGIQPEDKYYKHEDGKSEANFDKYLAKKLGLEMAAAGSKFGSAFGTGNAVAAATGKKKSHKKFKRSKK